MGTTTERAEGQYKVVCAWCGAVIRLRERKDSEGMCADCFRRMLLERTRLRTRVALPDKASER